MKLIGADADFRAHAELTAIGELGRGVVQHDRAVHAAQEPLGRPGIGRDDAVRVLRPVAFDMRDRRIHAVDDAR